MLIRLSYAFSVHKKVQKAYVKKFRTAFFHSYHHKGENL